MLRPRTLVAVLAAALTVLGLVVGVPTAASGTAAAADQTLTWTANDSITAYASFPTTAVAGATTIVFENSEATGNTTGMTHTLTFDTSTPGYNHDVNVNITASPFDSAGGHHEQQVTLTAGKYRFFCAIPGHQMVGELTVTGGGGEDTTPPTVSARITGERDADGNYVGSATATLTATDDASGVDSVEYSLDGGAWTTYGAPVVVDTVGDHMLSYRATDVAGNTSPEGMSGFTVVSGGGGDDTTPPAVSAAVTGDQDADGNYVGSATVTVTATDDGSGVASVEYEVDDTGFQPYTGPVTVSTPGDHAVQYRATDAAGNTSATGSTPFRVVEGGGDDTTPPAVSAEVSGTRDADGNYVDSATVTLSATDDASGVDSVEYSLDGAAFAPYTEPVVVNAAGAHMLHYRATDGAGNVSPEGMAAFTVVKRDTTAPTVSGQVTGQQDADGNYVGSAVVTVSASDDGSGVASVEYSLDGAAFVPYTEAVQVGDAGSHTVAFRATDVAGNVSEEGSVSFSVVEAPGDDTTPPSVSAVVSGNQDSSWHYLDSATLTIDALDVDSGVASVEYKLDDGGWTAYTAPVTVDEPGTHTVTYRATDRAGNVSAELSGSFTVVETTGDACPSSDTRPTVIIGTIDTGVPNVDTGDGCTINDLIAEDAEYGTHNKFVKHVNQVTDKLVTDGVITSQQRSTIVNAAIDSDVGKRATFA